MITDISARRKNFSYRVLSLLIAISFVFNMVLPPGYAQSIGALNLPAPGAMVTPSAAFVPVLLKGMTIHPDNPLQFDFIIDSGNADFKEDRIKTESERLVKYFLASMTIPKDDLWVNLSPYESDRIIPDELGKTELGRDMLAQDYILKQLTASLMYPEKELGKEFWDKVYKQAKEKFGTTEIPVDTFNKVWILPETATVYEHGSTVYIVEAKLKVMLEADYLARNANVGASLVGARDKAGTSPAPTDHNSSVSTEIIREIILPEIEHEVNYGQNFAPLRQIYHSLILAKWYKETIKNSLLSKVYVDKKLLNGIRLEDGSIIDSQSSIVDQIYDQYMEAYKKGVFNYIKEDYVAMDSQQESTATSRAPTRGDRLSNETIPRKYFSGGEELTKIPLTKITSGSSIKGDGFLGKGVKLFVALTLAGSLYQSPAVFAQPPFMPPIEERSVYNPATGQTSEVWVTPDLDEFIPGPKFLDFIISWLSQPDSLGIGWSLEVRPLLGLTFENENLIKQVSELKDEEIKGSGIEYLSSIGFYVKYEYKGKEYFRSLKGNSYVILPKYTEKLGVEHKSKYPIIVELSMPFLKRQQEFLQEFGFIRNSAGRFVKFTEKALKDLLFGEGGHLEYSWSVKHGGKLSIIYNNGEKARFWFGIKGQAFERQFFSSRIGFIRHEGKDSVELTAEELERLLQEAGDSIDPYYDGVTIEGAADPRSSKNLVIIIDKNKVSLDLGDEGRKIVNKFLRTKEPWKSDLKPSSSPVTLRNFIFKTIAPLVLGVMLQQTALSKEGPRIYIPEPNAQQTEELLQLDKRLNSSEDQVSILRETLKHKDWVFRYLAVQYLGQIGPQAALAVPELRDALLLDTDWRVRNFAIGALVKIGYDGPAVIQAFEIALRDGENDFVRGNAAWALGQMADKAKSAVPKLMEIAKDRNDDSSVRSFAIQTLGEIGQSSKESIPILIANLGDPSQDVKFNSINSLRKLAPFAKDYIPIVIKLLRDDHKVTRLVAVMALGIIGPASDDAIPQLIDILSNDKEEDVRLAATMALGDITTLKSIYVRQVINALQVTMKKDESARVRSEAKLSLEKIIQKTSLIDPFKNYVQFATNIYIEDKSLQIDFPLQPGSSTGLGADGERSRITSSPVTPQEAEAMIKGKLAVEHHHLIKDVHVQMARAYEGDFDVVYYAGPPERIEITRSKGVGPSSSPLAKQQGIEDRVKGIGPTEYDMRNTDDEEVGGIDMNTIDLDREGAGVDIQFDPAELQRLIDTGIDGFAPVIINITPLPSVLPLLGLDPANKEEGMEMSRLD